MVYFIATLILNTLLLAGAAKAEHLCADSSGVFVGLAIDEDAYDSIAGSELTESAGDRDNPHNRERHWGPPIPSPAQKWVLTTERPVDGPKNSYAGKYLQVLDDVGRTYPYRHYRHHVESAAQLEGDSPYVSFLLRVSKQGAGWHTLFVRWTGGDDQGRGDSFYVVMKTKKGKVAVGQSTLKPAVEPIDSAELGRYVGCCRDHETHVCRCLHEMPTEEECPADNFSELERAISRGVECVEGAGKMTFVKGPEWYLFAGQEYGKEIMDFDSEPWDATCEANGSNTKDSGHDFPSWNLPKGEYELRIYAREDGTALDGIYIAGPDGPAPGATRRYGEGDSTMCSRDFTTIKNVALSALGMMALGVFVAFLFSETGQELKHHVAMRVNNTFGRNSARASMPQGYELQLDIE